MFSTNARSVIQAERLGVALGPGLPIGLVGAGMLIALKELRIPVHMISGTSMGAIIGALYASGSSPEEIREHAIEIFSDNGVMNLILQDQSGFSRSTGEKLMGEQWFLIHRTEQMLQLGRQAAPDVRHVVISEPEGINLILFASKPLD